MNDGIYLEVFAVKGEKRYNYKVVSLVDLLLRINNASIDAVEHILAVDEPEKGAGDDPFQ